MAGERVVPVPPLDDEASLALFRDAATRSAPNLNLEANADRVAELCRLLGGLPLGLTLAANTSEPVAVAAEGDGNELRTGELWPWLWLGVVLLWLAEGVLANRTVA